MFLTFEGFLHKVISFAIKKNYFFNVETFSLNFIEIQKQVRNTNTEFQFVYDNNAQWKALMQYNAGGIKLYYT